MNGGMAKMMKQVQKMQSQMAKMQEELAQNCAEFHGGGAVRLKPTAKELVSIHIDPEVLDESNSEMLEDLVLAAVNEALKRVDEMVAGEMQKITGGLNLPPGLI